MTLRVIVLVLAAMGCSSPAMAPKTAPGQVVISGDATFRTREGDAIDVSVKRTFYEHEAIGTATLHGMTLEAAEHSRLVGVATARAWLSIRTALAADPRAAYEAARRGIDELGTEYRGAKGTRHIIDDTGNGILLAKMAMQKGDDVGAAEQMTKVLQDRIAIYLRTFAGFVE